MNWCVCVAIAGAWYLLPVNWIFTVLKTGKKVCFGFAWSVVVPKDEWTMFDTDHRHAVYRMFSVWQSPRLCIYISISIQSFAALNKGNHVGMHAKAKTCAIWSSPVSTKHALIWFHWYKLRFCSCNSNMFEIWRCVGALFHVRPISYTAIKICDDIWAYHRHV